MEGMMYVSVITCDKLDTARKKRFSLIQYTLLNVMAEGERLTYLEDIQTTVIVTNIRRIEESWDFKHGSSGGSWS
jgi:hypothetical protein